MVFAAAFASVYGLHSLGYEIAFAPPYYYAPEDVFTPLNAFFFSFIFSLLFFGYGAPLAMLVEGLKFSSYYVNGIIGAVDLLFFIPNALAVLAAIRLGHAALQDLRGEGSVLDEWSNSVKYFAAGLGLLGVLFLAKRFLAV